MLSIHRVDFIVVGGIGAVLQGAPLNTFDMDVVHSREEGNISRLLVALEEMDAVHRFPPERKLKPAASHLSAKGHCLTMTRFGPLDLLGAIGHAHSYEDLLPASEEMLIGPGLTIRVLDLPTLIKVKEEVAAPKDLAVLPILRRTLEERRKTEN